MQSAAAVRFAAITALATLLGKQLAPPQVLLAACTGSSNSGSGGAQGQAAKGRDGLLPLLAQCLDEDWYSDVRHTACFVVQQLLQQVRAGLSASWHA